MPADLRPMIESGSVIGHKPPTIVFSPENIIAMQLIYWAVDTGTRRASMG
jgi:hypothetical protein